MLVLSILVLSLQIFIIFSQSCLLYVGTQIGSGMGFHESKNLVNKDLAARNCLEGRSYTVIDK